jgi:enoyl-CoA hydratase
MSEAIVLRVEPPVATVEIDRPTRANALTGALWDDLTAAIDEAGRRDDCAVIVVRGAGDRYFSAGADLAEVDGAASDPAAAAALARSLVGALAALAHVDKPTLAVLNGVAVGGGAELALATDFRIAATGTEIIFPMRDLGAPMDAISLGNLVGLVGARTARRLLLLENRVTATRALELGLVDEVVPSGNLAARATDVIETLARAPQALRHTLATTLRAVEPDPATIARAEQDFARGLAGIRVPEGRRAGVRA